MAKITLSILACGFFLSTIFAQDDWEPQKHITGYLSLEANYYRNLEFFQRNYAVSMPESGVLIEYKPLKKMSLKGVFVYRPNWKIRDLVCEISVEWTHSRYLKIKGGHFLSPLSPINTSFYAPVNLGVSMPMIVSHHDHYPTTIEGLLISGSIGDKFKMQYCAFGGGYYGSFKLRHGAMNFWGIEDNYFKAIDKDTDMVILTDYVNADNLYYGLGGHLRLSYDEFVMVGVNIWNASEIITLPTTIGLIEVNFFKRAYGFNYRFKYNMVKLEGEVWTNTIVDQDDVEIGERKGLYVELSNSFDHISPYVKYEFKQVNQNLYGVPPYSLRYERYIVGLNYRPIFETSFNLEYFTYQNFSPSGVLFSIVYSF